MAGLLQFFRWRTGSAAYSQRFWRRQSFSGPHRRL